jgi:hypothetical protein
MWCKNQKRFHALFEKEPVYNSPGIGWIFLSFLNKHKVLNNNIKHGWLEMYIICALITYLLLVHYLTLLLQSYLKGIIFMSIPLKGALFT